MAAVDYFLKINGIPGESQDDKHKDEIQAGKLELGRIQLRILRRRRRRWRGQSEHA